jgi:citrate lyase beta subunit
MLIKKFPKSFLYTPAINIKNLLKEKTLHADVSVIDLEDSIPQHKKDAARFSLLEFSRMKEFKPIKAVRINSIRKCDGLEDVIWMVKNKWTPDIIIMTMVDDPAEIIILKNILSEITDQADIYITIETPLAINRILEIAAVSNGLIFGSADFAATLGVNITWDNMFYARSKIAMAAANFNIPAIDTACYLMDSLDSLTIESKKAREMGFTGKAAIHPSQLEIINTIFTTDEEELSHAQLIVNEFEKNKGGIIKINGQMIGPPFYLKAKKILARMQ